MAAGPAVAQQARICTLRRAMTPMRPSCEGAHTLLHAAAQRPRTYHEGVGGGRVGTGLGL